MTSIYKKILNSLILAALLLPQFSLQVQAHPGKTNTLGCHVCRGAECACWSGVKKGRSHCHEFKTKKHRRSRVAMSPMTHSIYQCDAGGNVPADVRHASGQNYSKNPNAYFIPITLGTQILFGSYGYGSSRGQNISGGIFLGTVVLGGIIQAARNANQKSFIKYYKRFQQLVRFNAVQTSYSGLRLGKYKVSKDKCNFALKNPQLISAQVYEERSRSSIPATQYYLINSKKPKQIFEVLHIYQDRTLVSFPPFEARPEEICYGYVSSHKKSKLHFYCQNFDPVKNRVKACHVRLQFDQP